MTSPTLTRVLAGDLCAGCGLCAGVAGGAVEMTTVPPGYARPYQSAPVAASVEARIATACPGAAVEPWPNGSHPLWGPIQRSEVGWATDPLVRHEGSSGGALTALSIHALESGRVDRVLHITADPERPTRSLAVLSLDPAGVVAGAGSRYAASQPLAEIGRLLDGTERILFIGKPCDVSALRRLARLDARVNERFPLMLAFFCAGVPSHNGADRVIRAMGLEPQRVTDFRYRGRGWPGPTVARTADGVEAIMRYADSWGGHLSKEVQFRCKICPDAVGGVADLACADAWIGGPDGYPLFEEADGRSLVLTRTAAGERLRQEALAAGAITLQPLGVDAITRMQPGQVRRKRAVAARVAACRTLAQPVPTMAGLGVAAAGRTSPWRIRAREWAGTLRRIALRRR